MKSQFFPNRVVWQLSLTTGLSRKFRLRANGLASLELLSCSATASMTLLLPCMLHTCANFGSLPVASHPQVQSRVSASLHNLGHFFTLSHLLPLHDSHLNIGLLIAKIQVNLARNKANKMVDKIQPYRLSSGSITAWMAAERFFAEFFGFLFDNTSACYLCLHSSSLLFYISFYCCNYMNMC